MSFKAAAGHHDCTVVKTEIRIPRNSVIKNNPVIHRDIGTQNSISGQEDQKKEKLKFCCRENRFQEIKKFLFEFQNGDFWQK